MTGYPELTRNYQSGLCAPRWAWQSSWEAFHSSTAGASRLALPPRPAVMVNLSRPFPCGLVTKSSFLRGDEKPVPLSDRRIRKGGLRSLGSPVAPLEPEVYEDW